MGKILGKMNAFFHNPCYDCSSSTYRSFTMPEILCRSQAQQDGAQRYFTGKPCIRGHMSERYTMNAACIECLTDSNARVREKSLIGKDDRRDVLSHLVDMGVRIFQIDAPEFFDVAVAMTVARHPCVNRTDVIGRGVPTGVAAGTGFYKLRVHHADVPLLRELAQAYRSKHSFDAVAAREARLGALQQQADAERDNQAGEWKFT